MKFIIQTIDNKIAHDFSFFLIESIKYHEWFNGRYNTMHYALDKDVLDRVGLIAVGSVEFVLEYLNYHYGITPKPINVPAELIKECFTHRRVWNNDYSMLKQGYFAKSNDYIKHPLVIYPSDDIPDHIDGNWQISEPIDIISEWRSFVFDGKLVGVQWYDGDFTVFPDIKKINKMIDAYSDCAPAYTLDVGINKAGTFVIEVHDFFSCGLYGFNDMKILPFMFERTFNYLIDKYLRD